MLKLYGGKQSRASIVRWYLEELGTPYEFILLDMAAGEQRQPEFLALNPFGKVPVIADGELTLSESVAILLYLAEKQGKLASNLEGRSKVAQWILFANSTLAYGIILEASRDTEIPRLVAPIDAMLQQRPWLWGEELSVVDIAVGSILFYAAQLYQLDFSNYPAVMEYIQRIGQRPAFQKTIGGRG